VSNLNPSVIQDLMAILLIWWGAMEGLYEHMAKENTVNLGMHPFFQLVEQCVSIFCS
jgi:hypothetical protein